MRSSWQRLEAFKETCSEPLGCARYSPFLSLSLVSESAKIGGVGNCINDISILKKFPTPEQSNNHEVGYTSRKPRTASAGKRLVLHCNVHRVPAHTVREVVNPSLTFA